MSSTGLQRSPLDVTSTGVSQVGYVQGGGRDGYVQSGPRGGYVQGWIDRGCVGMSTGSVGNPYHATCPMMHFMYLPHPLSLLQKIGEQEFYVSINILHMLFKTVILPQQFLKGQNLQL